MSTILCHLVHNWDIGLNSGIVPAKPGHLANMDKGAQERQSRMEIRTALHALAEHAWQQQHRVNWAAAEVLETKSLPEIAIQDARSSRGISVPHGWSIWPVM